MKNLTSDVILKRMMTLHPKVIDLTLDRVWYLLEALGNPQNYLPKVIHIAGTNGKGSTLSMLRAGLNEIGLQTHAYTSPHLVRFHERIQINENFINEDELTDILNECYSANNGQPITYFEITTCAAILAMSRKPADYILLEVGLGGRLDATNVIERPALTIITPVSIDHEQFLGTTIKEIASEKAGIIKPGVPVVIVENDEETSQVFTSTAFERGTPLFWAQSTDLHTDLKGLYQKGNLNGAAQVLSLLFPESKSLWSLGLNRVYENTAFFGRWTEIYHKPRTIADTGHNGAAFKFLVAQANKECKGEQHWIIGAAADKDLSAVMEQLPKSGHYYWVSTINNSRTLSGKDLALIGAKFGLSGLSHLDVNAALEAAKKNAKDADLIIVTGSTFVIADLEL